MAQSDLPNPQMAFEALQTLTAEEMNQLVQNINYLAALFPIHSSDIADNAITATKLADYAVTTNKLAGGAVTADKTNLSGLVSISGSSGDQGVAATRSDTNTEVRLNVGSGGANHGVWSTKADKWILYNDGTNTYLDDYGRVLGGWYLAGKATVTGATQATVTLPTANPWGLIVRASIEPTASGASWCDLRALDASGATISYQRSRITAAGTSVSTPGVATGSPFAVLPCNATSNNSVCEARSVRSAWGNYRSWTYSSEGGSPLEFWTGGSRQQNNTSIARIQCIANVNCNIHLEVLAKNSA